MAKKSSLENMHWSDWESVRKRLTLFGEAIQGPKPYKVVFDDQNKQIPFAGINYSRHTLSVNPKAFPSLKPKDQLIMTKALITHEAGHRRYSSVPKNKQKLVHHIANVLEDERIERRMRQDFAGTRPLLNKACHVMYDQAVEMDPNSDDPKEVLKGVLQLRWASRIRQPLKGLLSEKNYDLFFDLLPMVKEAWDAPNTATVEKIAQQIVDRLGIPPETPPPPSPQNQMGNESGERSQGDEAEGEDDGSSGTPPQKDDPSRGGSAKDKPQPKPESKEDNKKDPENTPPDPEPEAPKGADGEDDNDNKEEDDPAKDDDKEEPDDDKSDGEPGQGDGEEDKQDPQDEPEPEPAPAPADDPQEKEEEPEPNQTPIVIHNGDDETDDDISENDKDAIALINGIQPGQPQDTEYPISPKPYLEIEQEVMPGAIELAEELQLQDMPERMDASERGSRFNMREYIRNPRTPFQDQTAMQPAANMLARCIVDFSGSMQAKRSPEYEEYGARRDDPDAGLTRIEYAVRAAMMLHIFCTMRNIRHIITLTPNDNRLADLTTGEMGKAMLAGAIPALGDWDDMGVTIEKHLVELIADTEDPHAIKVIFALHDGMTNNPIKATQVCKQAEQNGIYVIGIGIALDEGCAKALGNVFGHDRLVLCKDPKELPAKLTALIRGLYGI